jgi:hypothetical protein
MTASPRRPAPRLSACLAAAAILLATPAVLAQGAAKPAATKPGAKPDAKKAADDQKKADDAKAQADADQKKADDLKAAEDAANQKKADDLAKQQAAGTPSTEPPHEEWNVMNVDEDPMKQYVFIGARYRGNIIPKFMLNLFVDEGATIYSNTVAIELDLRKDGFSLIPALGLTEYGTGDILFKSKNSTDIPGNYSYVNSSMKAIYGTVDLLWSKKLNKNFEFEYGAGFGIGVLFGDLVNNWVYQDPTGPLTGSNGQHYAKCQTGGMQVGCNGADHKGATTLKTGDYTEPSWLNGGSKPVIFPWISFPQLGLRYKPVKNFVARVGLGFALTGFWFGLNGEYGLEQKPKP